MSLDSLYGVDKNQIANKSDLQELKTRVDTLEPKVTNLANITAKTNIKNTFLTPQTIRGTTAFVEFKKTDTNRNGWIGKGSDSSDDISVTAETNSLYLTANHNVVVRPGTNNQFLYEKATLSNDNEVANKKYVDEQNKYIKIVSQSSGLNANQILQWTPTGMTFQKGVYEFIIKCAITGKDMLGNITLTVNNPAYLNQGSTLTWSDSWDGNPNKKIVVAVHESKFKIQANFALSSILVFCRKVPNIPSW